MDIIVLKIFGLSHALANTFQLWRKAPKTESIIAYILPKSNAFGLKAHAVNPQQQKHTEKFVFFYFLETC